MNGVSRKRPAEVAEPPESEVFKKCYICRARPASIRCGDCLREHRAELMCYGCSRKVHSEKLHHAYEYATFKDMLLQEEEKSFQDTDSFPTNSLMKMEGRSSKPFYDDDNDRMTQDASFISAVDAFAHQNDSPTKRQYQTFGRRSDQFSPQNKFGNSPTKSVQNASEPEDKENRPRDRHGNERHERLLREASRSRLLSGSSKPRVLEEAANSNQGKSHHHSISTNTSSNNQKAVEERTPIRDNDERRQRLPPRNERAILREVAVNNQTEKPVSRPEQDNSESKYTRTSRPINNSRSYDRAAAAREFEESSPVKVTDQNKLPQDSSRGYTPTKSVSKQGTEHRLLSGSNWKSKSKATDNHPQLMHSPAYIDSITELHKTEIESMKTKHRVEIDRLESELCSMSKTYESELKMLKDGAKEAYEELTELHIKVDWRLPERGTREGRAQPEDPEQPSQGRERATQEEYV